MPRLRLALPFGIALAATLSCGPANAQICGGPTTCGGSTYRDARPDVDVPYSYDVRGEAATTYTLVPDPRRSVVYREVVAPVRTNLFYEPVNVQRGYMRVVESDVRETSTCASPTFGGATATTGFVSDIKAIIDLLDYLGQRPGLVPPRPDTPAAPADLVARLNGLEARVAALEAKGSGGGDSTPATPDAAGVGPLYGGTRPIERQVSARQHEAAADGESAVALLKEINGKLDNMALEHDRIRGEMQEMMRKHERVHHGVAPAEAE